MSKLLSLIFKKERCEWFAHDLSGLLAIMRDSLNKIVFFICFWQFFPFLCPRVNCSLRSFLICSFLKSDLSDSLLSLFTTEQHEWFVQVAHDKKATLSDSQVAHDKRMTVSDLLRLLMKKEERERFTLFQERITLSLTKKEQIAGKSEKLMSEFPTLPRNYTRIFFFWFYFYCLMVLF